MLNIILFDQYSTVAIRMRPLNKNEHGTRVWTVLPDSSSVVQTTPDGQPVTAHASFQFDKTFGEDVTTQEVYDTMAKGIVTSVCTGFRGTILAHGQTSSGKTYTMQGAGTLQEGASGGGGLVHLASMDIFKHVEQQTDRAFSVKASFGRFTMKTSAICSRKTRRRCRFSKTRVISVCLPRKRLV